jgi:hypothetical protein
MRDGRTLNEQIIVHNENLAGGGASVMPSLGGIATARNDIDCQYRPYLRFGLRSDVILTLDIEVSMDNTTYTVDQTLVTVANTWFHVYDLPSPRNQTGFYLLGANFVRFKITNNTGGATTSLNFFGAVRNK